MSNNNVISFIKKKTGNDNNSYVKYFLGPELRYSGTLPCSNNNNLEEFLLLGTDRIINEYDDNGVHYTQIDFRRESDIEEYYYIKIVEYQGSSSADIVVEGTDLVISDGNFTYNPSTTTLEQNSFDSTVSWSNNGIVVAPVYKLQSYILKYRPKDSRREETDVTVAEKLIKKEIVVQNGIDHLITKEIITNRL